MAIPVWELKKGQRFRLPPQYYEDPGEREVFRFDHMDGMYCYAVDEETGSVLNWSGVVEPVVEKLP